MMNYLMMKTNKLLAGLQKRLIDIIPISAELFFQERPWLLGADVNSWELFHDTKFVFKDPITIDSERMQHTKELDALLEAIDHATGVAEVDTFFDTKQQTLFQEVMIAEARLTREGQQRLDSKEQSDKEYEAVISVLDK